QSSNKKEISHGRVTWQADWVRIVSRGNDYGSLKSPACTCVSTRLPASSQTRITASSYRLRCIAYPIALVTAFGSPHHRRPNGSASEIRSTPRLSLHGLIS